MAKSSSSREIYLELGAKRVFAGAVHWPGWCRSGKDEESAIRALLAYGERYAGALESADLEFDAPESVSSLRIVERLQGNATTDFGAPDMPLSSDGQPIDSDEAERFQTLLEACWKAFDQAIRAAEGRNLRKGPRGGGRDLARMVEHVLGAHASYFGRIGWKANLAEQLAWENRLDRIRQESREALAAAIRGELPTEGPRGGKRWVPRYFVRRAAWHVLDHAWEIEDRIMGPDSCL